MARFALREFRRGNFIITLILIALVIFVLSSAEIFRFKSKFESKDFSLPSFWEEKETADVENQVSTEVAVEQQLNDELTGLSPLQQVQYLVKSDYVKNVALEEQKVSGELPVEVERITWDRLRSRKAKRYLRSVSQRMSRLASDLGENYPGSQEALYNLSANLNSIVKYEDATRTADEVVAYLEKLDQEVTNSMANENAPRSSFVKWSGISLAPVFGNSYSDEFKKETIPEFRPKITLLSLRITKRLSSSGSYDPDIQARAHFKLLVNAPDAKKFLIYNRGSYDGRIPYYVNSRNRDEKTLEHQVVANDIYTLEIVDKEGNIFRKQFNFIAPKPEGAYSFNREKKTYVLRGFSGNTRRQQGAASDLSVFSAGTSLGAGSANYLFARTGQPAFSTF